MTAVKMFMRPGILVIFTISVLHIIWGAMLLDGPLQTVGIALISKACGSDFLAGIVLMASGGIAMVGVFAAIRSICLSVLMFFPQQFILAISAISAIECVFSGQYADGVVHPSRFIFSDQAWCLLLFCAHGAAIFLGQTWVRHVTFVNLR